MLSGFMTGMVYTSRARSLGVGAMKEALLSRAWTIYTCQAALLVFAFTIVAGIAIVSHQDAVTNLLGFYIERPFTALVNALFLVYSPALLDILPIYIVFMVASPWLLTRGMRGGWSLVMTVSVMLWLAAQFELGRLLYEVIHEWAALPVSYRDMGAFEIFAWQFLWVLGLWMGSTKDSGRTSAPPFPRWLVNVAIAVGLVGFTWRHTVGQTPFPGLPMLNVLFDKWHVGPLRLINFMALLVLVMHFGPKLTDWLPRLSFLEVLGAASLSVFCAHLVFALTALALFGAPDASRPWGVDVLMLCIGLATLYAVAWAAGLIDRRQRYARKQSTVSAPSADKSRSATAHNLPG